MSDDSNAQMMQTGNDALEASDADESPEGDLGDGGTFGKFCLAEGRYKKSCQNCPGFACNLVKW